MPGARLPIAALAAALTLLPSTAVASTTATYASGVVTIESTTDDERNDLATSVSEGLFVVAEDGDAELLAGTGCFTSSPNHVRCGDRGDVTSVVIKAGPGDDQVFAATDTLPRTIEGGAGDDSLFGGRGADTIAGGDGTDFVDGGLGKDTIDGGGHPGLLELGDTVAYGQDRDATSPTVVVTLPTTAVRTGNGAAGENDSLVGIENFRGGPQSDQVTGSAGSNIIEGYGGGDQISDAGGNDQVHGGPGADVFNAQSYNQGADLYDGGEGRDYLWYGARQEPVSVVLPEDGAPATTNNGQAGENDQVTGLEKLEGTDDGDSFIGNSEANELLGLVGDDYVAGLGGNDIVDGGAGIDEIEGGAGDDDVVARDGDADSIVDCGDGNDRLVADNALEAVTRPAGCETIAPQFTAPIALPQTPRVGQVLTAAGATYSGDAATVTGDWVSCANFEDYATCEEVGDGTATYTVRAEDLGRYIVLDATATNAAGDDWSGANVSGLVQAALLPVEEQPADEQEEPKRETVKPQPGVTPPAPAPAPAPVVAPQPRAVAPSDAFLAAAQRLLGARARALGSIGSVRAYGAPGKGLALVCVRGRCPVKAGGKRFTLAAGKARRIGARKGAKVRVSVGKRVRTLRAS